LNWVTLRFTFESPMMANSRTTSEASDEAIVDESVKFREKISDKMNAKESTQDQGRLGDEGNEDDTELSFRMILYVRL